MTENGDEPTADLTDEAASPHADAIYRLVDELSERILRGEPVNFENELKLHPADAGQLREVFDALDLLGVLQRSASTQSANIAVPTHQPVAGVIGDFRVLREIGRGGMGVVYEAEQISLQRKVALKVFPFAGICAPRQLQRFQHEAKAAASLHHPHIVPVFAVGCERGMHFYAMQYIEGRSLACLIDEMRQCWARASHPRGTDRPQTSPPSFAASPGVARVLPGAPGKPPNVCESMGASAKQVRPGHPKVSPIAPSLAESPEAITVAITNECEPHQTDPPIGLFSGNGLVTHDGSPSGSPFNQPQSAIDTQKAMAENTAIVHQAPTIRQIAVWGIQAAQALDYAHAVGVIHRDIKPANIMLDSQQRIWVTDFGLAQIATADGLTMTGDIIGTLRYMSPEQAVGARGLLDQRTDVYSLGATLYELLSLQPVFGSSDRAELLQKIVHEEPPSIRSINRAIPKELATIVHKALERDVGSRYLTASQMADDLQRFLNERPIHAKPPTIIDRCRKWSRRHRGFVKLATLFACLTLLTIGTAAFLVDRERQKNKLDEQARESERKLSLVVRRTLAINGYVTQINLADRAFKSGDFREARKLLSQNIPDNGGEELRNFEWYYLRHVTREPEKPRGQHRGMAYCVRLSPDGRLIATSGQDGIRLWDAKTFALVGHLIDHQTDVNSITFSADGSRMASAGDDHNVRIWNTRDWKVEHLIPHVGNVVGAMFVPGRNLLVSAERHDSANRDPTLGEDVVHLWDTESWEPCGILQRHSDLIESLSVSPDGELIATGSDDGTACVWDLKANKLRHRISASPNSIPTGIHCVMFSNHSPALATASGDGAVRLWRTDDGSLITTLLGPEEKMEFVAFSPDDTLIAAGGRRMPIQLWHWNNVTGGRRRTNFSIRAPGELWGGTLSDDHRLFTTGTDGAIREWDILHLPGLCRIPIKEGVPSHIDLTRDGRYLVRTGFDVHIYRVSDATRVQNPDSTLLQLANDKSNSRLTARVIPGVAADDRQLTSSNSYIVAVVKSDGRIQVWHHDRLHWEAEGKCLGFGMGVLSADGKRLAIGKRDGFTQIIKTSDGTLEMELLITPPPWQLALSPDGKTLASSSNDGNVKFHDLKFHDTVKIWSVETGRQLLELETGCGYMSQLVFSHDGRTLAALGRNILDKPEILLWTTSVHTAEE